MSTTEEGQAPAATPEEKLKAIGEGNGQSPEDEQPVDLSCPECRENGEATVFQTPQGLAAHRRRVHGAEVEQAPVVYPCPECAMEGKNVSFARPQALGAHRSRKHGVAGTSLRAGVRSRAARKGNTKAKTEKKRDLAPEKQKQAVRSASLLTPAGMNEREFAAFRLGSLRMLFRMIEDGAVERPAPIFMEMFESEANSAEEVLKG